MLELLLANKLRPPLMLILPSPQHGFIKNITTNLLELVCYMYTGFSVGKQTHAHISNGFLRVEDKLLSHKLYVTGFPINLIPG